MSEKALSRSSATQVDCEKDSSSNSVSGKSSLLLNSKLERIVWRKLDLCVLPIIAMFYFLSFLDRTNLGNARVAGLQRDLKMNNHQYSVALTVTYVPYIVAELPSNLLLKVVGPNLMLPAMLTVWGIITTLQGVVHNYAGLLACRFFLGLFEGGVFPGLVLYLSLFYPRQRLQSRVSAFFSAASISGAFSGLLAFGIINMDGVGNRPGWAWIFILEGLFTVVFGVFSFFFMPRSPEHARFFNEEEKAYVMEKLREDNSIGNDQSDSFSWIEVGRAFMLPQVWLLAITFFFAGKVYIVFAGIGLGYTATRAQLMSVPPFAAAFVTSGIIAYISDRYHCRGFTIIFCSLLCVIGFAMYLGSTSSSVQYGSLFLSITGTYCSAPALSTWSANNAAPHVRRATAIAIGFIMTNSGGILATWLLGSLSPPPRYTKATITLLVFSVLMVVFSAFNLLYLWRQNQKKARFRASNTQSDEPEGLGDRSACFGPILLGVVFESILYGIFVLQAAIYYQSYRTDPKWTRYLVLWMFVLETIIMGIDIAMIYTPMVTHAGERGVETVYPKLLAANPIMTVLLSTPVQLFMARRIYIISRSIWVPIVISLASLAAFVGGMGSGASVAIVQTFAGFPKLEWSLNLWLVSSAIGDAIITIALVWYLSSRRTGFQATDDVLNKVIRMTVQTGLITSAAAITNAFLCAFAPFLSMNFLFAFGLSKLYTNSLLSTLNARSPLGGAPTGTGELPSGVNIRSRPNFSRSNQQGQSAFELEQGIRIKQDVSKQASYILPSSPQAVVQFPTEHI
ncbi:hypothetical protein CCMSSC00406_0007294 [Pleurotus cornucopiae]|uniref:Uncharacterized protein n=1 Tax=Pleurotus cornucopiae TaxID=5321 RepID=A0ACB7IK76_PLECO|nr:hypothetical protein CCMSSC00406_0007294 [Pleurotus cornucopiae]